MVVLLLVSMPQLATYFHSVAVMLAHQSLHLAMVKALFKQT
jgi:hypothetical protein